MADQKKFIPYPFYWDDAPIDLSFIYEDEKPAGKHGFLKVKEDKFEFEDGTEAKFWGTNFNSKANFPEFYQSKKIAKRLAKFGINIVRFHQLDAEWSTPNIFQFTKGKRKGNTRDFDPESIKRLDYLIYCLKQEGIYMYLDMITYRKFKSGDGVDMADKLGDAAKPYSIFDRRLIELQKKFNYDLWTHINPYTELAYKDDPAIVLTEITNECDLFYEDRPVILEPYRSRLEELYRMWADKNQKNLEPGKIDFTQKNNTIMKFLCQIQEDYFIEMYEHMRNIGVRIPITGTNWTINAANRFTHRKMDFCDGHAYWYEWKWKEDEKKFDNRPMVAERSTVFPRLSFSRVLNKPYFVSEWDDPWPNEWRAESPLFIAAVGALQGWSGLVIHTYRYGTSEDIDIVGKEISSSSIGGAPYREGLFSTFNDPAKFGLFYHAALLFRRYHVKTAKKSISIEVNDLFTSYKNIHALNEGITEIHKVGMKFCKEDKTGDKSIKHTEKYLNLAENELKSDTSELYRNFDKKIGWVNTSNTKILYGFTGKEGKFKLGVLEVDVKTDFATIALSSLTSENIENSNNLLLTIIGRSENKDMKFNETHDEMLDFGKAPILVENIEAKFRIKNKVEGMRVISINVEGFISGYVQCEYKDGYLEFDVGKQFKSIYYLIQAE